MKKPILHFDESNMAGYDWSWTFFLNKTIDGRFTVSAKQTVCEDGAIRIPARRGLRDGVDVYGALYAIVDGALELQQSLKPLGLPGG